MNFFDEYPGDEVLLQIDRKKLLFLNGMNGRRIAEIDCPRVEELANPRVLSPGNNQSKQLILSSKRGWVLGASLETKRILWSFHSGSRINPNFYLLDTDQDGSAEILMKVSSKLLRAHAGPAGKGPRGRCFISLEVHASPNPPIRLKIGYSDWMTRGVMGLERPVSDGG